MYKLSHRSITCSKWNIFNKMGSNFLFPWCPSQLVATFPRPKTNFNKLKLEELWSNFLIHISSSWSTGSQLTWCEINKQFTLSFALSRVLTHLTKDVVIPLGLRAAWHEHWHLFHCSVFVLRRGFQSISRAASSAGLKGPSFSLVCLWKDQIEKLDFPEESNYTRHLPVNEIALSSYENL